MAHRRTAFRVSYTRLAKCCGDEEVGWGPEEAFC
jgi:hypothetical protein